MAITILVCGTNLKPVLDPITRWTSLECTAKHNDIGTGQFTAPSSTALYNAVTTPNNRITVIRNGAVFMSGPITKAGAYKWSAADGTGPGELTVTFDDNLVYLAERLTYPNPAVASTAQSTTGYYTLSATNSELAIRTLVNANAGPAALAARRVTSLALGPSVGVGTNINVSTRFEGLLDVMRQLAHAGGGLGFRIRESGAQLLFECYAPADKTKVARFSRQLGNLRELTTDPACPAATVAIVGGVGSDTSRVITERAPASTWRRMETFVNQSGVTDGTVTAQAGDKELKDKAETVGLTATAIDTPAVRYGVDYQLGDRVAVVLANGAQVVDVVGAVKLSATPDAGEVISPAIGTGDPHTDTPTVLAIRDMYRRLGRLERT